MKTIISSTILFVITISFSLFAQSSPVVQKVTGLLPLHSKIQIVFSAVNKNVCWGCDYYDTQFIRTTDGGANWMVSTVTNDNSLVCERIAAINADTAFVVMYGSNTNNGIYRTSDGGSTWTRYANAYNNASSNPIQIYFFDSNHGVSVGQPVGGNWEIYTTSNGGTDWASVPSANIPKPLSGETAINGFPGTANGIDNSFWFVTLSGGSLYGTSDRGKTWFVTRNFLSGQPGTVAFKDSLNGVAENIWGDLSITSDGGHTWQPVQLKFSSPSPFGLAYIKGTDNSYLMNSAYNNRESSQPTNPGTAYSSDGGRSWKIINKLPNQWPSFAPDGTGWSAGVSDSIFKWIEFSQRKIVAIQPYIDRTFAMKNVDSVLFRTGFLNLNNRRFTAHLIYTNLENTQTDSLTLYDDGLHGDLQPDDGSYGSYIPPMSVEDYFKLLYVSTTEDSTNKYVKTPITQYRFTTVGPVKLDSLSISKVSSTSYNIKPFFRNESSSSTINNLKVKLSTKNILIKIDVDTINISSIAPGATAGPTNAVNITVNSRFSGPLELDLDFETE